jgi:Ca2+-binding EF-hand superfamily protein
MLSTSRNMGDNNALSKLQPAQIRELREGFQILDRDNDGQVGRDDVADMLTQLGAFSASIVCWMLITSWIQACQLHLPI